MDFIKDIVNVSITNVTGNTNTTDLNTILILAEHNVFAAPVMYDTYTSAAEAKEAGFTEDSYVYKSLQLAFSQIRKPRQIVVGQGVAQGGSYIDAFDRMQMIEQGWLWLVSDLRDVTKQLALAKAVQETEKFYVAASSDAAAVSGSDNTDIGSLVKQNQLTQTYCWFDDPTAVDAAPNASEIALLARCGGDVAGTVQFLLKELVGVPAPTKTVDTRGKQLILTTKGYTYAAVGNKKVYSYGSGKVGNGEWIDARLAATWIKVNIRERVFNTLTSVDKLPMENDGASVIEGDVRAILTEARDLGIVAKDTPISVTVPDVTTLSKAQRASRELPRVMFKCRLSGAIVGTTITGEVWE